MNLQHQLAVCQNCLSILDCAYGKLPIDEQVSTIVSKVAVQSRKYVPTLEEASVKLFRVVLLPADGLPTSPMRGSRGMAGLLKVEAGGVGDAIEKLCNI